MIDPYRMVLLNTIGCVLILTGTCIYRYLYPKRSVNFFLLLLLFSLLACVSIFRPGVYESGDFTIHLYRTIDFYQSLQEGNLIPSWAGGLNATYGYPLFIFNYPLPYYGISLFHFLGFSFITSMKLFLAIHFILSGSFMYVYAKQIFKNNFAAFTSSIFYQFAPYHLIDLHFKVVIGELMFFTFLPLFFLSVQKFITNMKKINVLFLAISFAILVMSHVVIAFFAATLATAYVLIQRNTKLFFVTLLAFGIGAILSLYVWLTPFFLSKYTLLSQLSLGRIDSRSLSELLYSPWRMGFLFQGPQGEISHLIGYTQILLIIFWIALILLRKITKKYHVKILFWLFSSLLLIFLITPAADLFWRITPFIGFTGNHRLLLLLVFCTSLLAGYLASVYPNKQKFLYILILVTILSTLLNWGHRRVIPHITDQVLIHHVWKSTAEGEGHYYANSQFRDPKHPWFSKLPSAHLETIKGTAEIKELERKSTKHIYIVNAKTPTILRENTLYFPGWQVRSNTNNVSIKPDKEGIITFQLPQGLHLVEVTYTDLESYKILKLLSVSGFITILFALLIFWKRAYER